MKSGAVRKAAWFCLPFTAAIAACRWLLPARALWLFLLCCGVLSAAGFLFADNRRTVILLTAVGLALGCVRYWTQQRFTLLPAETLAGQYGEITARAVDYPDVYDNSEYLTVRLTSPEYPRVNCRLITYVPGELASFRPGDQLRCQVRFSSASVRSGQEIDTYTSQGIFLRAVCTHPPESTGRWRGAFLYLPRELCRRTAELCRQTFPPDTAPFMTALLTGDKTDLYRDGGRYYDLGEAGLAHVVAVSGMHLSCLLGFLYLLLGRNKASGILGVFVIAFFTAMTGFTPSVTRAAFMHACLICAPLFHREEDTITSLSVVLAAILLLNPMAVAGASLQLSFASMAGIHLVSPGMLRGLWQWARQWKGAEHKFVRTVLLFVFGAVSVSIGAQIFTVPLAAVHFGYVSVVSPLSGVLCLWLISALFIGGYAAAGLTVLLPSAGTAFGRLLSWGVRYIYAVTDLLRRFPCEAVYTSHPVFAVWLGFVYVLFLIAWLWSRKKETAFRPVAPVCLSLICLWCCALLVRLSWSDDLTLTALNVGQGESVVLSCGPRTVMVDCGGSYLIRDAGETAVQYLSGRQRRHLDALILSHLHSDHVNGAAQVLSQLDVEALYLPRQPDENGCLPEILSAAAEAGTRVEYVDRNMTLMVGGMELQIWAPLLPGEENENCLTVLARQGEFDALITGDNLSAAETALTMRYALPDVEVLVAGHHGSATSTCELLLRETRPDVAVISVGANNSYGHPSPQVLERLESYGISIHRTDLEGTITVKAGKGS